MRCQFFFILKIVFFFFFFWGRGRAAFFFHGDRLNIFQRNDSKERNVKKKKKRCHDAMILWNVSDEGRIERWDGWVLELSSAMCVYIFSTDNVSCFWSSRDCADNKLDSIYSRYSQTRKTRFFFEAFHYYNYADTTMYMLFSKLLFCTFQNLKKEKYKPALSSTSSFLMFLSRRLLLLLLEELVTRTFIRFPLMISL